MSVVGTPLGSHTRHRRGPRRALAALTALTLGASLLGAVPAAAAPLAPQAPAVRAAAAPVVASLAGSLQSELGCPADWDPACLETVLTDDGDGTSSASFALPAGSYEFKIALNGSWDENYGLGGAENGANIPVVLDGPTSITFTFDQVGHQISMTPTEAQPGLQDSDAALAGSSLRDDLTREQFYFVMADRFANSDPTNDTGGYVVPEGTPAGDERLTTGFDPTAKGFYHGGDINGITEKLDYLQDLGITSVWLTPSFKNKPVQGEGDGISAGYHGYWITDFTQIDPHLGTNEDLTALIDAAHAKGMKVFFDIIANHTADVISTPGTYITKADQPYRDASGAPFDDRDYAGGDTFPTLDPAVSFPYPPTFPTEADRTVKVPSWLNDPTYYHNRGNAAFDGGESDIYGDFVGLDDLFTENPDVIDKLIDVYSYWAEYGIDGFRIDTVKHVNIEFWQKFSPAMRAAAATVGKDKFFMFGEVYDANPANMSRFTTEGDLQATLDFGFQSSATGFAQGKPTSGLRDLFAGDDYYTDANSNVYSTPTFLGNHDMGRIGRFLTDSIAADGPVDPAELLDRDELAHSLMYLTRGQPVVYYGDEQGFVGDPGGDQNARQDMFPSQVASYNDDDLIGTDATTAQDNFGTDNPVFTHIAEVSALRTANPALADGAQIHRYSSNSAGIYAFSRIDATDQVEYVVAANNSEQSATATFDTFTPGGSFGGLYPSGSAGLTADDEGRVTVTVPPLSVAVWKAAAPIPASAAAPAMVFTQAAGSTVGGRAEVGVSVPAGGFNEVSLAWRPAGTTDWTPLGTDDNAPYRVFHDVQGLAKGTVVEYRAVLKDNSGNLSVAATSAVVGDPAPAPVDPGQPGGPVEQPDAVSVPGDFNSEIGCAADWSTDCPHAQLTKRDDDVWSGTFTIPAGSYVHKVAIDNAWTENYGAGGAFNGANIPLVIPAGGAEVTFYYDHGTHWVTTDLQTPIVTAAGSFQSELGCPADWSPDCLRSWLQDPDGDGIFTFATASLPAGSYETKATVGLSFDENYGAGGAPGGANIPFTVTDGAVVRFSFDSATKVLTVTSAANTAADLSAAKGQWIRRGLLAWDLPAEAAGWTFRLYSAPTGGLGLDAEAITGGDSIPLTRDPAGLPADLAGTWPQLAAYDTLRLRDSDAADANLLRALTSGQLAVAAFDDTGALVDATGVQIPGVLDDLYPGARNETLGLSFRTIRLGFLRIPLPVMKLWAPTASAVSLRIDPPGASPERLIPMYRDRNGVWTGVGLPWWIGATYAYDVTVYVPSAGEVRTTTVTDPYSIALTTNSERSVVADLSSSALKPAGWNSLPKPDLAQPEDSSIYELQIRDFSISDETVPEAERGTYLAFTHPESAGMTHLTQLADAGLNTVHLLPAFDIATIEERRAAQQTPACDLAALSAADPAGTAQQECVDAVAGTDGFNWGYDPFHYTTPEGSYATNPDGAGRTREFRQMVAGLNRAGLRVVMDVVYNHTASSGQDPTSVLDKVVPGYYQRLSATGALETSTCCANTASEHAMMEKLLVDSIVTWAVQYKVDGFRFDLMGHHSKATLLKVRAALDALTVARDGVDGKKVYVYGEGWNFGEVADNARFEQATQANMAGTGIGTFNDRLRDGVRGGGPFDEDPRVQGFGSGLFTDPNALAANDGDAAKQTLLQYQDWIKVGLTGNLRDYPLVDRTGATVTGGEIPYGAEGSAPVGYTADPSEVITYVDAHDNETLFDSLTLKLPVATTMADRVRMNTVSLSTTALSQGPMLWHAGVDLLRSKSLDRNSFNSGDWFNRIDWTGQENTFGSGLPPATDNEAKWPFMAPLLANTALRPQAADMAAATAGAQDLLKLRFSSPLFRLGSAELIEQKVSFPFGGPDQTAGVIVMVIDDTVGPDVDPDRDRIVVVFNASAAEQTVPVADTTGMALSAVQAAGSDAVVKQSTVGAGGVTVPARTVAVFEG
ncbi:pullulanase-type alpha-1,6-glucosidase [Nakamurella flavida]|uniref:Pullulanase-type alpha-1,6-glucosidase n=1 Tax=Nakamurella flavida TaxID=363630 RepID=A0A938YNJ6_9ACTN|nr:pullulanase-type alpha-1,6-glucosidase [Nakamurella flavida]MBM9478008.1 pullulanase-type alpha-1,6-glucosidase [Nakamurella flavida]MDP9778275.1 pullulanase-type alpha-1,6-glucosidase [Nakamurella flavida]